VISVAKIGYVRRSDVTVSSEGTVKKAPVTAMALAALMAGMTSGAIHAATSVLRSLPTEVQKEIQDLRVSCREHIDGITRESASSDYRYHQVTAGDDGLAIFTVSGMQAVMVNDLELCGGECLRGTNCSNRNSYKITIYVHSGKAWKKVLSTNAVGMVFLSIDMNWKEDVPLGRFKALVLSVFSGNKDCPTHDVPVGEGRVFSAWRQACDAVVRWDGTKFTYKPL
jgi:hypothetical protein